MAVMDFPGYERVEATSATSDIAHPIVADVGRPNHGSGSYDPRMVELVMKDDRLVVRLNPIEKLAAFRRNVSVPFDAITNVSIVEKPWDEFIPDRVKLGFQASTSPGRKVAAVGPRASSGNGKALLVVYTNGRSVVVDIDATKCRYSLVIVSVRDADADASLIRRASLRVELV
jgi:hypothetical protein